MARHGIPERVVSDNGPQYSSEEFRSFAQQYEFEHVTSSPGYPQSNGKAESAVKQAKRIMEKAIAAKEDPYLALLAHRNTSSDGMTTSLAQRLFGRRTRTQLPTSSRLLDPVGGTAIPREELTKAKFKQALYYDRSAKPLPELQIGAPVHMLPKTGEKTWVRAKVTAKVSPRSYIVATQDGARYRRNRRHLRKTAEETEKETDTDLGLELDIPKDANHQQLVVETPATNVSVGEEQVMPVSPEPCSRAPSRRQTRRPAYLNDYVTNN